MKKLVLCLAVVLFFSVGATALRAHPCHAHTAEVGVSVDLWDEFIGVWDYWFGTSEPEDPPVEDPPVEDPPAEDPTTDPSDFPSYDAVGGLIERV